jgi:hypothetical protein
VDKVIWYNMYDETQNPADAEANYGLLANDFTHKQAYSYYRTFQSVIGRATSAAPGAATAACSVPATLEIHSFRLQNGGLAVAVWKTDDLADTATVTVNGATYGDHGTVNPLTGATTAAAGVTRDTQKMTISNLSVGKVPVILVLAGQTGGTPAPKITSISPTSSPVGTVVTIAGSAFGATQGTSSVFFGATRAVAYSQWSDTSVTCMVPAGVTGVVQVTLANSAGTSSGVTFTAPLPPATVTGITPNWGAEKTAVAITDLAGTGFQQGATVRLEKSGVAAVGATAVQVASSTKITCTVNVAAGVYDVVVHNPDGQEARLAAAFMAAPACGTGSGTGLAALIPATSWRLRRRRGRRARRRS